MTMPQGGSLGDQSQPNYDEQAAEDRVAARDHLLALVLGETLSRRREDPSVLVEALRAWRSTLSHTALDQALCQELVGQVLRHRLGSGADQVPRQLRLEVGTVLWNDPTSRTRIERLFSTLGTVQ